MDIFEIKHESNCSYSKSRKNNFNFEKLELLNILNILGFWRIFLSMFLI